jgi:hypothetical protein
VNNTGINTYSWRVQDDISAGRVTKIRIVDTRDAVGSYDVSDDGFRIRGWFDITKPAINDAYIVGRQHEIRWTTFGTMPTVKLEYSKDNFTDDIHIISSAVSDSPGPNLFMWTVPNDIVPISDGVRVRVTTIQPNDPDVFDDSVGFKIRADIIVTKPIGGERWITNETQTITWVITGTVPSVTIYYSIDAVTDTFKSPRLVISETANTGYYYWKIPDEWSSPPTATPKAYTKVMVCDSRDLASSGRSPNTFRIDYYYITFNVRDSVTRQHMRALTFMDPTRGWSEYPVSSPRTWGYPYGTYTTIVSKTGYLEESKELWVADRDQTFTLYMESSVVHAWQIAVDFKYDPVNDSLFTTSWFMRDGIMMYDPPPDSVRIDIYDQEGNFKKTLQSSSADLEGVFRIPWENTGLLSNTTYWAKTELTYSGVPFRSALTYNINIPTKLNDIDKATANVGSMVSAVISNTDIISATANKIDAATGRIERQIVGLGLVPEMTEKLASISSSLAENIGDIKGMISNEIRYQFRKGVQSEILTRYTLVKSGETIAIRYRVLGKGLSPVIDVYDGRNIQRVTSALMTEITSPEGTEGGVYEYKLTFQVGWGEGDFTIICSEATTKAMDSMVVTVVTTSLEDVGTSAAVLMGQAAQQKDLSSKLDKLDGMSTQLGAILSSVTGISKSTAEGKIDPGLMKSIDDGIRGILDKIKNIAGTQGFNFDTIYQAATTSQENNIKEIMNRLSALQQISDINRQILERTEQKFLISSRYEWGSVKMKITVLNKDTKYPQQVPVKSYLPQEVKPEDVIENKSDFVVAYDSEKQLYFVELPVSPTLNASETKEYEITLKDVWVIKDSEIQERKDKSDECLKQLEGKKSYDDGTKLYGYIGQGLDKIVASQKKATTILVVEYISNYRNNLETLKLVDNYLERMRLLVHPELAGGESPFTLTLPSALGTGIAGTKGVPTPGGAEGDKTLGITAESSWKIILMVISFLGLLSIVFFLIWQSHLKKARVSPELSINPEEVQMPEVGKSETEER